MANINRFKQTDKETKNVARVTPIEDRTMVIDSPVGKSFGPRLVCTTPKGESKLYAIKKDKLIIGRSSETDIHLLDQKVSRKHGVIEKQKNCYLIRNVSTTNPLFVNDKAVTEKRLYSGDQLTIGSHSISFISDRPEDDAAKNLEARIQKKGSGWGLWMAAAILFVLFSGYLFYDQVYNPWKIRQTFSSAIEQIESNQHLRAQISLKALLATDLSPENTHKALQLMAETALAITQKIFQEKGLEEAKGYLTAYLAEFGAGKESELLWDRLDYYRLSLGRRYESEKENQLALRQYAAIRETSLYFGEAQKAIRRIWLVQQKQTFTDQTLAQLLKEAETHFQAQRYLTPVNQNAFAAYQAVLSLKPGHQLALERIDQIKAFYRQNGESYFKAGDWARALTHFERYVIIDTEDQEVIDKIGVCRQKMSQAKAAVAATKSSKKPSPKKQRPAPAQQQDPKREEIKRLLEESGTESNWIMEYLFEDQDLKKDPDKPW